MHSIIENNKQQIIELCKEHHVKELYAFGSVIREDFNDTSDVDLLYRFYENELSDSVYANNFFDFKDKVTSLLRREVDLVAYDFLSNPYFIRVVEKAKEKIYG